MRTVAAGTAPESMACLDMHARLPSGVEADHLLATMTECGIHRAVISAGAVLSLDDLSANLQRTRSSASWSGSAHGRPGQRSFAEPDNEHVLVTARAHPGRFIASYFVHPGTSREQILRVRDEVAVVELAPVIHHFAYRDWHIVELLELIADSGQLVYTVCTPRPGSRVTDLVNLARQFDSVTFLLGHAGVGPLDVAGIGEIARSENIVVESSCALFATLERAVDELGPARVVFGSEYPHQHPSSEIAKILALEVNDSELAAILGGTGKALLSQRSLRRSLPLEGTTT